MAFICLQGFSKEPCLFCRPGLFFSTLASLMMGYYVPICPFETALAYANRGLYANSFWLLIEDVG